MSATDSEALVVIDVQNDFCSGGALAVPGGEEVVPVINRLAADFRHVVLTQDWHPAGHFSFASSHPGKAPMELTEMPYGPQVLWPDHCVQGTPGAELAPHLQQDRIQKVFQKGTDPDIDSYSGFYDNGHRKATGLGDYLKEKGIKVDEKGFEEELKKHQELSRAGAEKKFKGGLADTKEETVRLHTAHHLLLAA
mgnify:CR=1 FL=1